MTLPKVSRSRWREPPVLLTLPMSHSCEKGRWALDHAGVLFREHGHVPVLSRFQVSVRGTVTVPILLTRGRTVRGSTAILEHADRACPPARALYPLDAAERREVDALVAEFTAHFGPSTRRWMYSWASREPSEFVRLLSPGLSARQQRVLRGTRPGLVFILRRALSLGRSARAEETARVEAQLATVSERLSDGRPYLVGERFGAADLTFAALSAPALMPPGYGGGHFEPPDGPPAEHAAQVAAWRATPAGEFALRMYREHRLSAVAAR